MEQLDYEVATSRFGLLVADLDLTYQANALAWEKEKGVTFLPFSVTISNGRTELLTKWSAGEGIAYMQAQSLSDQELRRKIPLVPITEIRKAHLGRRTLHKDSILQKMRTAYRPTLADVLHSLVLDAQYADDPEQFGELFTDSAKAIEAWQIVQVNAPKTRNLFGSKWDEAQELTSCM